MNLLEASKKEKKLIKAYLKAENKFDTYYQLNDFYYLIFYYLNDHQYVSKKMLNQPIDENLLKLSDIKQRINALIKNIQVEFYKNWITSENKDFLFKNACNFDRKLKVYDRKINFTLLSTNDPFTEDEIAYILEFSKDVYPEKNIKSIHDIPLNCIQMALCNLLSN